MKISDNKFVSLSYDLNVGEQEERELMEKATAENPLTFISGMGMMLDAFEKQVLGLKKGDTFSFSLVPEQAYGSFEDDHIVELPKNIFEVEGEFDNEKIAEGLIVPMMDSNGNKMNGAVVEVKDEIVIMDFNHPLAGETLHFEGSIIEVREATAEEIVALSAGSSEGGCGCSSGGCGSCGTEEEPETTGSCGCETTGSCDCC
ncbi:peptidyl-prolyl cis-trans isomerase [Bacteroidales bacterium]|nr:peptidyl-prolyl cis-trans isomerase [Bacteroidales bacterium]